MPLAELCQLSIFFLMTPVGFSCIRMTHDDPNTLLLSCSCVQLFPLFRMLWAGANFLNVHSECIHVITKHINQHEDCTTHYILIVGQTNLDFGTYLVWFHVCHGTAEMQQRWGSFDRWLYFFPPFLYEGQKNCHRTVTTRVSGHFCSLFILRIIWDQKGRIWISMSIFTNVCKILYVNMYIRTYKCLKGLQRF